MLAQLLVVEKKWRHQCSLTKAVGSANYTINPSSFLNHVMPPCSSKHKYQGKVFIKSKLVYSPLSPPLTLDPSSVCRPLLCLSYFPSFWHMNAESIFSKVQVYIFILCHTTYSTTSTTYLQHDHTDLFNTLNDRFWGPRDCHCTLRGVRQHVPCHLNLGPCGLE